MRYTQLTLLAATALTAGAAIWGLSLSNPAPTLAAAPAASLSIGGTDDAAGGSITGTIMYEGRMPAQRESQLAAASTDAACKARLAAQGPILEETYVWGDKKSDTSAALQNVFVYVSKGLEGKTFPAPKSAVTLDQKGCIYSPHIQGMVVGQEFNIHNSDATLHNLNCQAKNNPAFNVGQALGMVEKRTFAKAEGGAVSAPILIKCDVHAWMNAYVHVMAHPFFAVTGKNGSFTIKGLPPGNYEVTVWHEYARFKADKVTIPVVVTAGKATEKVDFLYKLVAAAN